MAICHWTEGSVYDCNDCNDYGCSVPVNILVSYCLGRFNIRVPFPVPSAKRACRAGKCSPILSTPPPVLRPGPRPLRGLFPSAPPSPPRFRSRPHSSQVISRPHLLHADACPLSADTLRKLERRPLVRRLFCLLLPRRHNRQLPLPSTTGMVPWLWASRCWEISQSIYVKVCTRRIIV